MTGLHDQPPGRAVVFSPFFYPEAISTGRYNTYLAKALVAYGWSVDVVTSHPLYPDWKPARTDEQLPGVSIHRGGARMRYPRRIALRRLLLEGWFAWHALVSAWQLRRNVDIAVFVFPPVTFAVLLQWLLPRRVRTVGIVHDLQGMMMNSGVVAGRGLLGRVVSAVEGYALRRCDRVICLSRSMAEVVTAGLGVEPDRCTVRYPFVTQVPGDTGQRLNGLFEPGGVHVVYSGALGKKQMPDLLLEFFEELVRRQENILCHIFSRGPLFEELQARRDPALAERIRFHDLVPEEALDELYARSDVQVIPQASGTGAAAFPSKLPNLLAAGVPVFAICDAASELAQVIAETGAGVSADARDPTTLADQMVGFLSTCTNERRASRKARLLPHVQRLFAVEQVVKTIVTA